MHRILPAVSGLAFWFDRRYENSSAPHDFDRRALHYDSLRAAFVGLLSGVLDSHVEVLEALATVPIHPTTTIETIDGQRDVEHLARINVALHMFFHFSPRLTC